MAKAKAKPRKPGRRHKATPERVAKILAEAEKPKPGALRDRVVELRRVPAGELIPHPKNWRRHPKAQRDALAGLLREVGFAGALLARQDGDKLVLIDGHLRQETNPTDVLPVLVTDLSEAEAELLLASFDPLAAMAETDKGQLAELLASLKPEDEAVKGLLGSLRGEGVPAAAKAPGPTLSDRFGVPPFSVLDARQGYWQERKRAWLSLGIQSELGRGNENLTMSHPETTSTIDFYARKRALEAEHGRELTKDEAAALMSDAGALKNQRASNAKRRGGDCTPGGRGQNSAWFGR